MEKFRYLPTFRIRQTVNIMDVAVDVLSLEDAVATIEDWSARKRQEPNLPGRLVVTANPEYIMAAHHDPEMMNIIQGADMVTPDGVGLTIAGKLLGTPLPGRVTGVELSTALAQRSAESGLRLFLLGAAPGVAEEAAENLQKRFPGVNIVGCFAGKAGPEGDEESLKLIRSARPDVVLVAYGMGKQDRWSMRNLDRCGAAVSIGVGGTFDYISGRVPQAPLLVRKAGMEWAFRLMMQPWRWRRDIAMLQFGSRAVWMSLTKPVARKGSLKPVQTFEYVSTEEIRQTEHIQMA